MSCGLSSHVTRRDLFCPYSALPTMHGNRPAAARGILTGPFSGPFTPGSAPKRPEIPVPGEKPPLVNRYISPPEDGLTRYPTFRSPQVGGPAPARAPLHNFKRAGYSRTRTLVGALSPLQSITLCLDRLLVTTEETGCERAHVASTYRVCSETLDWVRVLSARDIVHPRLYLGARVFCACLSRCCRWHIVVAMAGGLARAGLSGHHSVRDIGDRDGGASWHGSPG